MDYKEIFSLIGEKVSEASAFAIRSLSELGLKTTPALAKWFSIVIILIAIWVILKFATSMQRIVKFLIIIILIILAVSIGFSMFTIT